MVDQGRSSLADLLGIAHGAFEIVGNHLGIDPGYLVSMLHVSWMSRPNNVVVPCGKMGLAMQLIFTPMILRLMDLKWGSGWLSGWLCEAAVGGAPARWLIRPRMACRTLQEPAMPEKSAR